MKLTLAVLCILLLQAKAGIYAQVNMNVKDASVETVIEKMKSQTKYDFLYNDEILDSKRLITLNVTNATINEVLELCFKGTEIEYTIVKHTVLIKSRKSRAEVAQVASQVTGRVTDSKGQPLQGVTVKVKGATIATQTDADGNYKINVSDKDVVLVFSFIGYATQEKAVNGSSTINIILADENKSLNEVVVIGYGTARRGDFTGSAASLKLENSPLAVIPNTNPLQALQGSVTGLNIGQTVDAGGQPSIQVRGQNSIRGNNAPLIIVDGVIYLGDLNDINPNDIASYDILKDAVAAAVYGSRSSNGVIAITLKKGKSTRPNISLTGSTAFQTWQRKPDIMNASQWIETVNAANSYAPGSTYWLKPQEVANMEAGNETRWLDLVTRRGSLQNSQIAFSGANNGINYYVSAAYDKNKGIVVNDDFERVSALAKLSVNVNKWLQLGLDGGFARRDYSGITPGLRFAQIMSPYGQVYRDDQGNLEKYPAEQGLAFVNPLWGVNDGLRDNFDIRHDYRLNTFALLKAPWIEGLSYRLNFNNNLITRKNDDFTHEGFYVAEGAVTNTARYSPATLQSYLVQANGQTDSYNTYSYVLDNILNYNHNFGSHNIDVTAVATRDYTRFDQQTISGSNFATNGNTALGVSGLGFATTQKITLGSTTTANIGYLARVNYSYDEKYYLSGAIRRDGASVFGADRKWGNFGAVGAAWVISNERFLSEVKPLNRLKLKLSWGQNGNQGIGPYNTLAKVNVGVGSGVRYEFYDTGSAINYGLVQANLGNSALGWESTEKWNSGFESVWLNNRLFVDLDAYLSKTTNEIYTPTIPSPTGFTSIVSSLGEVHNKGLEVTLRTVNIKNTDLNWSTTVTYWINRNKLVHIDGRDLNGDGKEDDRIADGMFIGQPLNAIFGYVQDGIVQPSDTEYKSMPGAATIDGYPKYKDLNGDGQINADDRDILGYPQEKFRLNMSNTISYKNFEFYALVTGVFGGGGYYMKSNPYAYMSNTADGALANLTYKPYWTTTNLSNVYPAAFFKSDGGKFLGLQSRTFVRLQNVTLSYVVPQKLLTKFKLNSFRIFVTANNPVISTNWFGGDPEVGTAFLDNTKPVASTYSLGFNTSF